MVFRLPTLITSEVIGKNLQSGGKHPPPVLIELKLDQRIIKGESPCIRNLKMTSHLRSHNFQILKIEIFSKLFKILTCNLKK